jgi:Spy/CpxP family protein refolding chaperone
MGDLLKSPGLGRWLALALAVSLALNLFFGGVLAGRWLRPPHSPWSASDGGPPGAAFTGSVGERYRPGMDAIWQRHRGDWRERAAAVSEARQALRRQLMTDPADKAAIERTGANVIAQIAESQKAMHRNLAEVAATLPPEERERFLNAAFERSGRTRHMRSDQPRSAR